MDCRDLPRAQLNVRRRTANISMELASSSISVFVLFQQPMAKKCQGNDPQADSVFCFTHYLSVNTLDALVSKTITEINLPGGRSSPEVFQKLLDTFKKNTAKALTQSGSGLGGEHQQQMMGNSSPRNDAPLKYCTIPLQNRATCALQLLGHDDNTPQRTAALADFVLVVLRL